MPFYDKHLFFCCNQRPEGKRCCNNIGAEVIRDYTKEKLKDLGIHGPGKVRVSMSGCLGRCADGPSLVIYPDGVWYHYESTSDIDEIIENHLLKGNQVPHLLMAVQDIEND